MSTIVSAGITVILLIGMYRVRSEKVSKLRQLKGEQVTQLMSMRTLTDTKRMVDLEDKVGKVSTSILTLEIAMIVLTILSITSLIIGGL